MDSNCTMSSSPGRESAFSPLFSLKFVNFWGGHQGVGSLNHFFPLGLEIKLARMRLGQPVFHTKHRPAAAAHQHEFDLPLAHVTLGPLRTLSPWLFEFFLLTIGKEVIRICTQFILWWPDLGVSRLNALHRRSIGSVFCLIAEYAREGSKKISL